MPRYEFNRDHRASGGPRLSIVISSEPTRELAAELFEERWQQKVAEHQGAGGKLQVRTTQDIQAEAMTPAALQVKRSTQGIKG